VSTVAVNRVVVSPPRAGRELIGTVVVRNVVGVTVQLSQVSP